MADLPWVAAPSILPVRNLKSVRQCLTVFRKATGTGHLDLTKLTFMDPAAMVLMYHFASRMDPGPLFVKPPKQPAAKTVFDLHHGWFKKGHGELKLRSAQSYPLRFIKKEREVIQELTKWRQQIMELGALHEEAARYLSATLSEVLSNSFSHGSHQTQCIVAGQTFKKKGHTMIGSIDFGRTIPSTLRESGRYPGHRNDGEWILKSLEMGVTCRSRESNKGLGLYMLAEHVRDAGGTLIIVSGEGAVVAERGNPAECHLLGKQYERLDGTFIVVDVPTGH